MSVERRLHLELCFIVLIMLTAFDLYFTFKEVAMTSRFFKNVVCGSVLLAFAMVFPALAEDNLNSSNSASSVNSQNEDIEVVSYYFGNYHLDKRNEERLGKGWSEWTLVKKPLRVLKVISSLRFRFGDILTRLTPRYGLKN